MSDSIIELNNVSFSYKKENYVLRDITFTIDSGTINFLMGNNGSGKTTLLKLITKQIECNGIDVALFSKKVSEYSNNAIAKLVSYVPQISQFDSDLFVKDYLALGRTPYLKLNSPRHEEYSKVEYYSEELGIANLLLQKFNELSGGQKQIVNITRALVQETPMIIMDEPMSALDYGRQVEILKILCKLKNKGKTVVLSSHNPNHALAIDSNTILMKDGKIIANGKSKEVFNAMIVKDVFGNEVVYDTCNKNIYFNIE